MTRPISEYREALAAMDDPRFDERNLECLTAALDELEQARAQVQVLREALEPFSVPGNWRLGFATGYVWTHRPQPWLVAQAALSSTDSREEAK